MITLEEEDFYSVSIYMNGVLAEGFDYYNDLPIYTGLLYIPDIGDTYIYVYFPNIRINWIVIVCYYIIAYYKNTSNQHTKEDDSCDQGFKLA